MRQKILPRRRGTEVDITAPTRNRLRAVKFYVGSNPTLSATLFVTLLVLLPGYLHSFNLFWANSPKFASVIIYQVYRVVLAYLHNRYSVGKEGTVRMYVSKKRKELSVHTKVFVPQYPLVKLKKAFFSLSKTTCQNYTIVVTQMLFCYQQHFD